MQGRKNIKALDNNGGRPPPMYLDAVAESKYQSQYLVEAAAVNHDPYELHGGGFLASPTSRSPNNQDAGPWVAVQPPTMNRSALNGNGSETGSHGSGGTLHGAGLPPGPR
jgi:hypothetical protein